jgi:hypothetical protein
VTLAPRLLNYPAWDLRLNGQQVKFDVGPETGQILVPLRSGTSHIEIWFRQTRDRTVGDALSAVAAVALSLLALGFRPTKHRWLGALTKQEARSANR